MNNSWEYKTVTLKPKGFLGLSGNLKDEECTAALNREGALGWELVAMAMAVMGQPAVFYFKRPR